MNIKDGTLKLDSPTLEARVTRLEEEAQHVREYVALNTETLESASVAVEHITEALTRFSL